MRRYVVIIFVITITALIACKRNHKLNGVYHIYKVKNGKNSDPGADDTLKQKYIKKQFLITYKAGVVSLSDAADSKPIVLHRINGENGTVNYTPGGIDPFYNDTSPVRVELLTKPSDTILFINDKFFLSATGKKGGMIICYLTQTNRR
ncbi:MAG TPA: hypothetical protein VG367_06215 [Mucilaginibacter sp.]|jgi:hypothetical protein|nr:hypothetical protein [Mucilaginibacter sp.]